MKSEDLCCAANPYVYNLRFVTSAMHFFCG